MQLFPIPVGILALCSNVLSCFFVAGRTCVVGGGFSQSPFVRAVFARARLLLAACPFAHHCARIALISLASMNKTFIYILLFGNMCCDGMLAGMAKKGILKMSPNLNYCWGILNRSLYPK